MNVSELIAFLRVLEEKGKGKYKILDEGYLNEIQASNIEIDDNRKEIIL